MLIVIVLCQLAEYIFIMLILLIYKQGMHVNLFMSSAMVWIYDLLKPRVKI